jgi:hypothetical protein
MHTPWLVGPPPPHSVQYLGAEWLRVTEKEISTSDYLYRNSGSVRSFIFGLMGKGNLKIMNRKQIPIKVLTVNALHPASLSLSF